MSEQITLSDALNCAYIEKDHEQFCTVYLLGKSDNKLVAMMMPKVIGLDHVGKTDYEIIEEAWIAFNKQ